jgi:hypothetical protein
VIRAFVSDNLIGFRVAVTLVRTPEGQGVHDGNAWILRLAGDPIHAGWERIEDSAAEVRPTLTLGHEEARALLDGLAEHYQGASDTRLLRQDRDHERGRVDKLLDVVAEIAKERA